MAIDILKKSSSGLFNLEIASQFYLEDEKLPMNIRKAWYVFANRFLPCVNGEWLKCLTGVRVKSRINMFTYISVSDEAFARWVLEVKHQKIMEEQENGFDVEKKFEKPKGAHDSNKFLSRYNEIHAEVKAGRTDHNKNIYNNWFWTYFKLHNSRLFQETSKITKNDMDNSKVVAHATIDELIAPSATTITYDVDPNELIGTETDQENIEGIDKNSIDVTPELKDEDKDMGILLLATSSIEDV
jgi:hypothetical protein